MVVRSSSGSYPLDPREEYSDCHSVRTLTVSDCSRSTRDFELSDTPGPALSGTQGSQRSLAPPELSGPVRSGSAPRLNQVDIEAYSLLLLQPEQTQPPTRPPPSQSWQGERDSASSTSAMSVGLLASQPPFIMFPAPTLPHYGPRPTVRSPPQPTTGSRPSIPSPNQAPSQGPSPPWLAPTKSQFSPLPDGSRLEHAPPRPTRRYRESLELTDAKPATARPPPQVKNLQSQPVSSSDCDAGSLRHSHQFSLDSSVHNSSSLY